MENKTEETRRIRILIVEDEALLAEEVRDRLQRIGHGVVGIVDNGQKAIEMAAQMRPDLVLMDIRIKGQMDGIETAARIYQDLDIPIVYVTAHADPATLQRAKASGQFGYVVKPFQQRELMVAVDIAVNRHRVEKSLQEGRLTYATILASVSDGVIATDEQARVRFLNPVAEELIGWRLEEASGHPIGQVLRLIEEKVAIAAEDPAAQALRGNKVVASGKPHLLIHRCGTKVPVEFCASSVLDNAGRVTGAVVVLRNITERRNAEQERLRLEDELRQAQKMEAIGTLAGGIAHEFNNILTSVLGFVEIARWDLDQPRVVEANLHEVTKAANRAKTLVHQILAFSRREPLQRVVRSLEPIVEECTSLLRTTIPSDIDLQKVIEPGAPNVRADGGQIHQVLLNLCTNAWHALPEKGGRIVITLKPVEVAKEAAGRVAGL